MYIFVSCLGLNTPVNILKKDMSSIMKRIIIDAEGRDFLVRSFNVSEQMVSYALNFRRHSDLAKKIRTMSLQKGGKLVAEEEIVTIFESNGDMVQTWGDKARLVADRATGDVKVFVNGQLDRQYKDMSITDLLKEQKRIGLLVGSR